MDRYTVGIITASDKGFAGEREDVSGRRIKELLSPETYEVVSYCVLPDERELLERELLRLADECSVNLVLTTGGTGFSVRDVTPEATQAVCERMLSRGVSVIRGQTLIVTLPGSPKAVEESLSYLLGTLEHGMDILLGRVDSH